mgnify:CR=1 FL=1
MNNDSTRNGGRLSLQERAARGLLSLQENSELLSLQERVARGLLPSEPELLLSELMKLEFPSHTSYEERQQPEYKGWHKAIEAAIGFKLLKARDEELTEQLRVITGLGRHGEETRHFGTITRYWITRENYRAWRLTQNNPPAGSFIHLWLGATPATESIPPIETSLPEPARPARAKGCAAEKTAALLALLDEVDKRAAKKGAGFNRHCLPGTKAEFQTLAIAFNRHAFSMALTTFDDYLGGQCQFRPGAKQHGKGAAIWVLFPEYDLKLG